MTGALDPNALNGIPYGCGFGRSQLVMETGVLDDKGALRKDPARLVTSMPIDGVILPTERLRDKKGRFVPSEGIQYVDIHGLDADGICYHKAISSFVGVPGSVEDLLIAREQLNACQELIAQEDEMQRIKEYLLNVAASTTSASNTTDKFAYALLTYYLSDNTEGKPIAVADVLKSDDRLDVLAQRIGTATYTPKLAALIFKKAAMVEKIFGSSIAELVFDSVAKQYPLAKDLKPQKVSVPQFCSYYLH